MGIRGLLKGRGGRIDVSVSETAAESEHGRQKSRQGKCDIVTDGDVRSRADNEPPADFFLFFFKLTERLSGVIQATNYI